MDRRSFEKETREMRHLYVREKLSLREIANRFDMSFQAVHQRLVNAGVTLRPTGIQRKSIDKRLLERLHIDERLPVYKIAKLLKVGKETIHSEMKLHGIGPMQHPSANRKYPQLDGLRVGESVQIPLPTGVAKPYGTIYSAAQVRGMRLSVKTVGTKLEVTRKV